MIFKVPSTVWGTAILALAGVGNANEAAPAEVRLTPYLETHGQLTDAGLPSLDRQGTQITVVFKPRQEGVYSYGLSVEADKIAILAPGMPSYSADSLPKPIVVRYPYDWTYTGQRNVLGDRPRLVMPGIMVDDTIYVVDTHELWSVRLEATHDGRMRALLLRHGYSNDGGDRATAEISLQAGQVEKLSILSFKDLSQVNRARFGLHAPMKGRMTQIPYRGWSGGLFNEQQYRRVAEKLHGVFDYVVIREVELKPWIPPLFHAQGIKVIDYQYLGALRRSSSQVSPELQRQIGLTGSDGQCYAAPSSPDGAWLLCDLRQPEVRARFVDNARRAIEAGFDGVFLDGYPVWPDAAGRHGGNVPTASQSLDLARWQFLRDCRQAIRAANGSAVLGSLANDYYDALGEADFVCKERMYFAWEDNRGKRLDFDQMSTKVRQDLDVDVERNLLRYAAGNVVFGSKGYSPISVQTSLHFLRHPTELIHFDCSDFLPQRLNDYLAVLVAVATQNDVYLTGIQPQRRWVHFEGLNRIWADEACTITFSRPVCVRFGSSSSQHLHQIEKLEMAEHVQYEVFGACPNGR